MKKSDPYQWFFPLGILLGMIGVGLWIAFALHKLQWYPGLIHSELMTTGFIMTVAMGFLMTAIPRFTGTSSASTIEKLLPFFIVIGLLAVSLNQNRRAFYIHGILMGLLMVRFMLVRIAKCSLSPPPSFALVAFGLLSFLTANILLLFQLYHSLPASLAALARLLLNYGLSMGLILGIGTQLIPALLGLRQTNLSQIQNNIRSLQFNHKKLIGFISFGVFLLFTFILEALGHTQFGRGLRALGISAIILFLWKIYQFPINRGVFSWLLWISAWMFIIGMWPGVISSQYAIHGIHVFFIGSISIMIFTIATRVTLAHGGHEMIAEKKSKYLLFMGIFFTLALAARLAAPMVKSYFPHLASASALWILAALCWLAGFLKKLWIRKNQANN